MLPLLLIACSRPPDIAIDAQTSTIALTRARVHDAHGNLRCSSSKFVRTPLEAIRGEDHTVGSIAVSIPITVEQDEQTATLTIDATALTHPFHGMEHKLRSVGCQGRVLVTFEHTDNDGIKATYFAEVDSVPASSSITFAPLTAIDPNGELAVSVTGWPNSGGQNSVGVPSRPIRGEVVVVEGRVKFEVDGRLLDSTFPTEMLVDQAGPFEAHGVVAGDLLLWERLARGSTMYLERQTGNARLVWEDGAVRLRTERGWLSVLNPDTLEPGYTGPVEFMQISRLADGADPEPSWALGRDFRWTGSAWVYPLAE